MDVWSFLQCLGLVKSAAPDKSEPYVAEKIQPRMNDSIVNAPPEVGPRMDFLSGNRVPNDPSKVVKVWCIHYDYKDKLPFIDTLRVDVRSRGLSRTETKCLKYADVVKMEGGRESIAQFKPEFNRF